MEVTNKKALEVIGILDVLERGASFTPAVINKITTNRFELSDAMDDNEKIVELIKPAFAKTLGPDLKPLEKAISEKNPCFDIKTLQNADNETQKEFYNKFNEHLESNESYQEFLEKKRKIDFKPIYLKDVEKCIYSSQVMFLLKGTIFFREKSTVKPSIN